VAKRAAYKKLYANIDDRDEDPVPLPDIAPFVAPPPEAAKPAPMALAGWPLTAEQAAALQQAAGQKNLELPLAEGIAMKFALVPAGRFVMGDADGFADERPQAEVSIARPFYLGTVEVTNAQYRCFNPMHESGYIEGRNKDRTTRGTPANQPEQPVIRVSWNEATAFCRWLSEKTGHRCTLPSEAEWEWAARAGTETPLPVGPWQSGMTPFANLADSGIAGWNYGRSEPNYSDGQRYSSAGGQFAPNTWGLFDMHGNVAEWCQSSYRAYPYRADDGREAPQSPGWKVVRGGSWNDTMRYATSASRWRYEAHQPVYNVGFRVRVDAEAAQSVAAQ
jgi:formylglycine-generating enzyme required for sulfatase activity